MSMGNPRQCGNASGATWWPKLKLMQVEKSKKKWLKKVFKKKLEKRLKKNQKKTGKKVEKKLRISF